MKVIKCKCGCGLYMSQKKLQRGEEFWSPEHKEWYETIGKYVEKRTRKPSDKKKRQKIFSPEIHKDFIEKYEVSEWSYDGRKICLAYDDTNIQCVMCFENEEQQHRACFKRNPRL